MAKKPAPATAETKAAPQPFEEFCKALQYLLINEHDMPQMVADEFMHWDDAYLRAAHAESTERPNMLSEIAEELAKKPIKGKTWIQVDGDGEGINLDVPKQIRGYLQTLVNTGLYGDNVEDVASTMLRRGLEAVLPQASTIVRKGA